MNAITSEQYYHSIRNDQFTAALLHNVRLRKGILFTNINLPKGSITSPYTYFNNEQHKETVWDKIREKFYPNLPTRHDAFFMFNDLKTIEIAKDLWWKKEIRKTLVVNITQNTKIHRADTRLLDCFENEYESNAHKYWQGQETEKPLIEIVSNGLLYFPQWETFPSNCFSNEEMNEFFNISA